MLGSLARTFAVLSLLSVGGINAMVPEFHREIVEVHGWMDDRAFASLVAIAQVAPGPNLLIVSLIGWSLAGLAGLGVATLAMVLPSSLLALATGRLVAHGKLRERVAPLRRALAPVALGLMAASGVVMARAAYVDAASALVSIAVAVLAATTRLSPLWYLAGAAVLAVALHSLAIAF